MEILKKFIDELVQEAASIQIQGRALRPDEMARVQMIYQALPHLHQALNILSTPIESTLITYKIASDLDGKLKQAARTACNFWNRFLIPSHSTVIRLGIFTSRSNTIARAYIPYMNDGVKYGRVEFNTKYLGNYSKEDAAGTVIHEVGHTLGIGWDQWHTLYDRNSARFTPAAVTAIPGLDAMYVETDGGHGTQFAHWDEDRHDRELMTGYKNEAEYVLPVTIDIMSLLGHEVIETLPQKTDLNTLTSAVAQVVFTRKSEAKALNVDHFEETDLFEEIPYHK